VPYDLDHAGAVEVSVFNLLGQKVRTLYSGLELPGRKQVTWDGRDDGGRPVASGVYVVQLRLGDQRLHRRLLRL
jgi:flagellar hook assembly protein FlgD